MVEWTEKNWQILSGLCTIHIIVSWKFLQLLKFLVIISYKKNCHKRTLDSWTHAQKPRPSTNLCFSHIDKRCVHESHGRGWEREKWWRREGCDDVRKITVVWAPACVRQKEDIELKHPAAASSHTIHVWRNFMCQEFGKYFQI